MDPCRTPLRGRFIALANPPSPGTSLRSRAEIHAYDADASCGALYRGWCTGCPPHDGALEHDTTKLSYDDTGTGLWQMFLREDRRSVSRVACLERAHAIAIETDSLALDQLPRKQKKQHMERARQELLGEVAPRTGVRHLLVFRSHAWISGRTLEPATIAMIEAVLADAEPNPLAWSTRDGSIGWHSASTAVLATLARGTTNLSERCTLASIRLKGHGLEAKLIDLSDDDGSICAIASRRPPPDVTRLMIDVLIDGEAVRLELDEDGVYLAAPPPSRGGLLHEQIGRRLSQAIDAGTITQAALKNLVHEMRYS